MKKVAVVVQRYGLEVNGGAELEARLYAERLTAHYDVTVFTTCAKDYQTWKNEYPAGKETINGVTVIRFPNDEERDIEEFGRVNMKLRETFDSGDGDFDPEFLDLWFRKQGPYCPRLIEALRAEKDNYEAFVFMTYLYYTTVYGVPEVHEKAVLIPTAHDEIYLRIPTFQKIMPQVKALFFNSASEKRMVNDRFLTGELPSAIGGCGVDIPEKIDVEGFRSRYQIPSEYIVYAGRVDVNKGCKKLVEYLQQYNAKRVQAKKKKVPLVLVGNNALNLSTSDEIIPLGFVSENDKFAAISQADFLVLPSMFESLSIAVLEAFSLRKPVLVNGICETLKDHCLLSNGGLFYHDYDEFCSCMDYLMDHPKEREEMGKNGEYYTYCHYNWDDIIARLERLIEI